MSVASSDGSGQAMSREQRRMEREERKRKRNAQDVPKQTSSSTRLEKTPNKDDKKKGKTDFSASNGSATKKPPSGSKRTQQTYDKVKIIEKTSPQDVPEKENKGKTANDGDRSTRRRPGSKFMDNLSKFESQAKQKETKERTPFVRSYRHDSSQVDKQDPTFRRSYRPNRSAPIVDDPSILTRRSLRKEKVLESIAKLEKSSTKSSLRKQPLSPTLERSKAASAEKKSSSRPTSASSSRTSVSDSGSSSSSLKSGQKSRAQQALERHKERMRSSSLNGPPSPHKPGSPSSKTPTESMYKTPKTPSDSKSKTPKSKKTISQKSLDSPTSYEEPARRTISVTKSLQVEDDDSLQVTTATEVMTPMREKLNIVVKENAKTMDDVAEMMSPVEPVEEREYKPGDPRPISVGDAVAMFSPEEKTPSPEPVAPPSGRKRARRKLPEIPMESSDRQNRKYSHKSNTPEDGSGEPNLVSPEKEDVVVIETSPSFSKAPEPKRTSSNFNQNSNYECKSPDALPLSPVYAYEQIDPKVKSRSSQKHVKRPKEETEVFEAPMKTPTPDFQATPGKQMWVVETPPEASKSPAKMANEDPVQIVPSDSPTWVVKTHSEFPKKTTKAEKKYSPEEAIQELRRMSEEIRPDGTTPQAEVPVFEAAKVEDASPEIEISGVKPKKERRRSSRSKRSSVDSPVEERPKSLHIEEVLYISEKAEESSRKQEKPRKSSLKKQLSEEVFVAGEPIKHSDPRRKLKSLDLTPFEISPPEPQIKTPKSPESSSNKSPQKTPSPIKPVTATPKSPPSTKSSPVKSPTTPLAESPDIVQAPTIKPASNLNEVSSELSAKSRSSSRKSSSSVKSPTSPISQISSKGNTVVSPVKASVTPEIPPRSPKSPTKITKSPSEPKTLSSPEKVSLEVRESPIEKEEKQIVEEKPKEKLEQKEEMTGKRGYVTRRYKKSWLDESDDDDNISLLSDAASDDLEIDLKWLGSDSEDDFMPLPRKSSTTKLKSSGVQRSSSKAADMLAMWERKAAEPLNGRSPSKHIETEVRVGSVKAAWETKTNGVKNGREESHEKENKRERKMSGASVNGTSEKQVRSPVPSPRRSSIETKRKQSEEEKSEMKDIFNERVAGKILGAKALFENIAQAQRSPSRSPVVKRSPIKVRQDSSSSSVSIEPSPILSRKSSVSSTQVSEEISSHEGAEESQNVDGMRAMFENQSQRKEQTRKNKPSLADMVTEDDCEITDVRSVKAMWQSMDNHR